MASDVFVCIVCIRVCSYVFLWYLKFPGKTSLWFRMHRMVSYVLVCVRMYSYVSYGNLCTVNYF